MRKVTIPIVILLTAIVTAVLTSAFWLVAFNVGRGDAPREKVITETAEPGTPEELVLGPSGLAVPVQGVSVRQLVDTYAEARGGGTRVHDAIDIMAPAGTPVVAAAEGTVEKLFFSRGGGGISVYVRSPDRRWIYYYAHLQEYAPGLTEGQEVERGTLLGRVGSTGNASPDGPHLHFAVHRTDPADDWHSGTAVNPYPLLAGRR